MIAWLTEPLSYGFVVRGLLAAMLAAASCALLSSFVVWRGMAFIGDAIAHAILPGIVIAFALGVSLFAGALVAALVTALGIGVLTKGQTMKEDSAIGVLFTGLFALGIVLLNRVTTYQDLTHILFGSVLGVDRTALFAMLGIAILAVAVVGGFYKELVATSFDPGHARVIGMSPEIVRFGLLFLIALTVVAGIQTVGVVLVLALLITPAAAASLLAKKVGRIMVLSEVFAVGSAVIGFYGSYYLDLASGATVVVTLSLVFAAAFLVNRVAAKRAGSKQRRATVS